MPYKNPHPLYLTWAHIKSRAKHGGTPIDPSWMDFKTFLADVGERPNGHILTRRRHSEPLSKINHIWTLPEKRHKSREDAPPGIDHPLYVIWRSMITRCESPSFPQWADYGGRGISVCDRWRKSFPAFVKDMGERPIGCQLDRKDNDGNYDPDNCKWSTRTEQQRNRRTTVKVTIDGHQYLLAELASLSKLKPDTIAGRARKGLTLEQVLHNPRVNLGTDTHCRNGHRYPNNPKRTSDGSRHCEVCYANSRTRWKLRKVARQSERAVSNTHQQNPH